MSETGLGVAMTITDSRRAIIPHTPKEISTGSEAEIVDRAGNAILGLVGRAADSAAADLKEARELAEKLADELRATRDQLRAAHDQINGLKADVGHYQDRATRAEKWLQQISSEIEQRFFDATARQPLVRAQIEMTAHSAAPVEELIKDETQKIAAKFAPDFLKAKRH
jgi:chromosome segregation ATPase